MTNDKESQENLELRNDSNNIQYNQYFAIVPLSLLIILDLKR